MDALVLPAAVAGATEEIQIATGVRVLGQDGRGSSRNEAPVGRTHDHVQRSDRDVTRDASISAVGGDPMSARRVTVGVLAGRIGSWSMPRTSPIRGVRSSASAWTSTCSAAGLPRCHAESAPTSLSAPRSRRGEQEDGTSRPPWARCEDRSRFADRRRSDRSQRKPHPRAACGPRPDRYRGGQGRVVQGRVH